MNISMWKLLCSADVARVKISSAKKHIKSKDAPEFTVTYHAGAMHTKANTVSSVIAAIEHGAKIVEFDVSFRPDGTPVIIHSSAPSKSEGILLKDALAVVADNTQCKINLDIKSTANLGEVDKLVRDAGLFDRVFYTGVFADWVDAVKSSSQIPYYLNHKITAEESTDPEAAQKVADKAKSLGAVGINSNFRNASVMFVEKMKENGLPVSLWTVNKISDMVNVIDLRPDNITTKYPHIMNLIFR